MNNTTKPTPRVYPTPTDAGHIYVSSDFISDHALSTLLNISFCFIGVIALFGTASNILNITIFIKQGFKDTTNISLLGISIADFGSSLALLWSCICVSPVLMQISLNWEVFEVVYITSSWPRLCFVRVTGMLTALITVERYLCIAYPLKIRNLLTPSRTITLNIFIFVIMTSIILPVLCSITLGYKFSVSKNHTVLGVIYSPHAMKFINITTPINNFFQLLAFVIVALLTTQLVHKLNNSLKWRQTTAVMSKATTQRREQRVAGLVIFISISFIFCFLPAVVIFMATRFEQQFSLTGRYKNIFNTVGIVVLISESINASSNIFIYFKMSSKYNHVFHTLLNCALGAYQSGKSGEVNR